jgi:hypothetical protein
MQVSIGYDIIEYENRVTGRSQNPTQNQKNLKKITTSFCCLPVSGGLEQKFVFTLQDTKNFEHFHIKTKQSWSACWKHGWIILKPGVQVSIGYCIMENANRVTVRSQIPQECKNVDFWATGGYICGCWSTK